jgi:hypothetical protein
MTLRNVAVRSSSARSWTQVANSDSDLTTLDVWLRPLLGNFQLSTFNVQRRTSNETLRDVVVLSNFCQRSDLVLLH